MNSVDPASGEASRASVLAQNLATVRNGITEACRGADRSPDEITLIAITKTYPASDVRLLADLGVRDFGENRHPEAAHKVAEANLGEDCRWHFVGGLQTNKAGAVARYSDVVQSVDRIKLADSLSRGAVAAERDVGALIQVDFDRSDPGRAGMASDQVAGLADHIASLPGLRLDGLMCVAPLGVAPGPVFSRLVGLSERLRADHPQAQIISAGMTEDYSEAISAGATHLRIGRAILGNRAWLG